MALTSPWLTVGEAAARLEHLGVTEHQAREMAISGRLHSRVADGNHWELCTSAVEEYADETASELAAREGEDLADTAGRPAWKPWTAAEDPDAHRDQADYSDTPNDEGDSA